MRRKRRPLAALCTVALMSLIGAGCSNAPSENGTGSNGSNKSAATHKQAAKFAACMRDNGVREFPDPDGSGEFTIDEIANHSSLDTSTAAFEQALTACKDLEPSGFTGHKRSAQEQEHALEFAECIRDNGVKDFPDPTPDAPMVDTRRIPSAAGNGGMTALNAAMQKCRDLSAKAGAGQK